MKPNLSWAMLVAVVLVLLGNPTPGQALGTAFTYQGQLHDGTNAAHGTYDVRFTLFASSVGVPPSAGPVTNLAVWVTNGLFMTAVDFGGGVFNGNNYWLELAVRTNGGTQFTTLIPRQSLTPVPNSQYAAAAGSVPAGGVVGTLPLALFPAGVVTNTPGGTIPLSELPASVAALASENLFSNYTLASGTSGGAISSYSYGFLNAQQYGGYATVPPVCYDTWDTYYGGYNSNNFASDLQFLQQTAPILLNYNQQGFALCIDDGLFGSRVGGILQINPTNFPGTASQLTYIAHTNGIKILCYMEPNAIGTGRTSAGFPDSEGTNIEWDASQFALMGFDGLKIDPHGWGNQADYILAAQRAEAAFRAIATNRAAIFLHDANFTFAQRFGGMDPNVSQYGTALPGTIVRMSVEFSDGGSSIGGWNSFLIEYIDNIVNLQSLNKPGQWVIPVETATDDWSGNRDTPPVQRLIELSSAEFGAPVLFDQLYGASAASLAMMTNTEILDVAYDPLWIIGQPVPNVGSASTFEVFVKALNDPFGGKELFLLNRNVTTAQNVAFTWPEIGFAAGRKILVRDTQAQTNFGVYSNAFSLNLPPLQCFLLRFEPVDNPWLKYLVANATASFAPATPADPVAAVASPVTASPAGANPAVTVTLNGNRSQSVRLDGLSPAGGQLLLQTVATLTNNLVLLPSPTCPLVISNGASGFWNSNGVTWLRTSSPGSTNVTDHILIVH